MWLQTPSETRSEREVSNPPRTFNFMIDESPSPMAIEAEHAPIAEDVDAIVSARAEEESSLSVPKQRNGGMHADILPGEVGPCTRCGWVWTPSRATLRRYASGLPRSCANCRSPYWKSAPVLASARRPGDPAFALRRDTIANRKKRRRLDKLKELAAEFNVEMINEPGDVDRLRKPSVRLEPVPSVPEPVPVAPAALDMTPRLPWQSSAPRPRSVIPPPPGMDSEER